MLIYRGYEQLTPIYNQCLWMKQKKNYHIMVTKYLRYFQIITNCFWKGVIIYQNNLQLYHIQVGEMKGKETRLFIMSRIRIPIWLCSLPIHSPGICMLDPLSKASRLCLESVSEMPGSLTGTSSPLCDNRSTTAILY